MNAGGGRVLEKHSRSIDAEFFRHVSLNRRRAPAAPSDRGGRWAPRGIPVLYVGRPLESVMAEAHRLLGEPGDKIRMPVESILPRELLTIHVNLHSVIELAGDALTKLGLVSGDLSGGHSACSEAGARVAAAGYEGLIARSATGLGETLAIFTDNLKPGSNLAVVQAEEWRKLPPDPRAAGGTSAPAEDEPYINGDQLGWRLGQVEKTLIAEWRKQGMPALRISQRKFVYRFSDVERWLRDRDWQ